MKRPLIALSLCIIVALGIGAPTPWTGLGFILTVFIFLGLGLAVTPKGPANDNSRAGTLVTVVALGVSIAVLLWSAPLYVIKDSGPGTLLIIGIAVIGFWRRKHDLPSLIPSGPELTAISIALFIGFYLVGINDFHFGDQIHFSHRYDWPHHGHFAAMIAEHGLPQVGLTGSPNVPFNGLGHTGLSVLIAGIEQLTQTTIYQALRILALLVFPMITLGAYVLLRSQVSNSWWRVTLCLAPLFWAGLILPLELYRSIFVVGDFYGVIDPYRRALYGGLVPSGTFYHNIPQGLSIAQGMAFLVALEGWRKSGRQWWFFASLIILGASMSIKPSLFIVLGPALFLILILTRARPTNLAIFCVAITAAITFYCLPAFITDLPTGSGWSINWHHLYSGEPWLRLALILGIAMPFMISRGLSIPRRLLRQEWQWPDITIVATCGAILFALIMREDGREHHGNHAWPMAATIVLLSPFIVGSIAKLTPILRRIATGILIIQLACGLLYAINYPLMSHRAVPISIIDTLERCRESSDPRDRFLIDPTLAPHQASTAPYLRRANPWLPVAIAIENEQRQIWLEFAKGKTPADDAVKDLVSGRTAVIIGPKTLELKPVLKDLDWQRALIEIPEPYELWLQKP